MTVCKQCGQLDMAGINEICFDCKEENRLVEIDQESTRKETKKDEDNEN